MAARRTKRVFRLVCLAIVVCSCSFAQLSQYQKLNEFQQLVALFNKRYALNDWKKTAISFDGTAIQPWLEKVNKSGSDLEFLEICAQYVASFQDGHSGFQVPSVFQASLGFSADLYSGKVLVDSVVANSSAARGGLKVGDEIVAVDGRSVEDWITLFGKFHGEGNDRGSRRFATAQIPYRMQSIYPRAHEIGDTSEVTVRKASTGTTQTMTIRWTKYGTPLTGFSPVPDPSGQITKRRTTSQNAPVLKLTRELNHFRVPTRLDALNIGQLAPVFQMPVNFVQHAGSKRFDAVFSGTMMSGGYKIGFLRIPDFEDREYDVAAEMQFLADTDALIIDVMHNPGGYGCEAEDDASLLFRDPFRSVGAKFRVTWQDIVSLQEELSFAQLLGFDDEIPKLSRYLSAYQDAYQSGRPLTDVLGICGASAEAIAPATDDHGALTGYTKPVMLLTDEVSLSAAEVFSAILQDNNRALIYGYRTGGAGGSVTSGDVGFYMEAASSVTRSIVVRKADVLTPEYPAAPYIENIGVRPDVQDDYMTSDNLLQNGKPFVDGFLKTLVSYLDKQKAQ